MKEKKGSKKALLILAVIFIAGILLITAGSYFLLDTAEKMEVPSTQTQQERTNYVMSKKFSKLKLDDKKKYLRQAMKSSNPREMMRQHQSLSKEERQKLRNNIRPVFRAMMKERMAAYFKLKTNEEKLAYLDKMIDERLERRQRFKEQMKNISPEEKKEMKERFKKHRKGSPPLDRIKKRIESSTPEERAQRTQFFMQMRARMQQRGIPTGRKH